MVLYGTYPLEMEVLYGFIWDISTRNGGFIWFYMVLYGTYPLEMEVLYGFIWDISTRNGGFIWFYMGHIH